MLIGRPTGPRFEATATGVRLIGYSAWPDLMTRRNAAGQTLRPSYAERVQRGLLERERAARAVAFVWDEVLALGLDRLSREELRRRWGTSAVAKLSWDFTWDLPAALTGAEADSAASVTWFSPVQPPFSMKDPWMDVPQRGLALIWVRTALGVWALDAPLDRSAPLPRAEADAARAALEACLGHPAARAALPATWPTGAFVPLTL